MVLVDESTDPREGARMKSILPFDPEAPGGYAPFMSLRPDGTPHRCRDIWAGREHDEFANAMGAECETPVPWTGAACPEHTALSWAALDTPIADIPTEAEARRRVEARAMSPETKARIAEAARFLESYAGRDDFMLAILADPKRGTKWFRVTEKMADAILRVRDREAAATERKAEQPRIGEVFDWLVAHAPTSPFAANLLMGMSRYGSLTERQYAAVVLILDQDATPAPTAAPAATQAPTGRSAGEGWYRVGETVYKVQKAVHGSGNLYAKKLVITGPGEATWEYAPGMVRRLTDADRLTVEAAAAYGRLYGVCCVCGATLTDEESIARGIGPVCHRRLG